MTAALSLLEHPAPATSSSASSGARQDLTDLAASQLAHALDARIRGLKVYESLKSLNDVIGTQYGDRVLFELVQNAHDAQYQGEHGEIAVRLVIGAADRGELLVANRGKPFSTSNLEAICNIGTSDKQIGEGIGNKGLGFRSVEALTDDVHIFSASGDNPADRFEGYCFRFSTLEEIGAGLIGLGAAADIAREVALNIPRYLVPVGVSVQSETVMQLARDGFATVVALPLASAEAVALARQQVQALIDLDAPVLLFLDRIAGLDVRISEPGRPLAGRHLTRRIDPLVAAKFAQSMTLSRVTLDERDSYLVVRRTLAKPALLEAVKASISVALPLKRWLDWRGEAIVSVAVPTVGAGDAPGRLFNFLPMDDHATSPIAGHIDAPFFADIDRRSMKPGLPLNRHLLDAAAQTAAAAALAIVDEQLDLPEAAVVDLVGWAAPHMPRIIAAFAALKRPLPSAAIWPVVSGGKVRRAALDTLRAWPEVRTSQLTPGRLAEVADAAIIPSALGKARLSRVVALALGISRPMAPTAEVLCAWTEAMAGALAKERRWSPSRWRSFYDDVVALFAAAGARLGALEGKKILVGADKKMVAATAKGIAKAPPVFVRVKTGKGRRGDGPPNPPASLARKFKFVHESIHLGESTQRAFEKAGLLRPYDPLEVLGGITGALGATPTDLQRREALVWSFKVWRAGGGKLLEDALRGAGLFVPTLGGWHLVLEALSSSAWSQLGRTLEQYLHEATPNSPDCARERERLVVSFADWPRASSDDREDWLRFLTLLGLTDGIKLIAGAIRRVGTPNGFWQPLFHAGKGELGLDARWSARARRISLENPQTDYHLKGEVWRLPGQIEHTDLPQSAKEALSDLIVAYLREHADCHFTFTVEHWRGWNRAELPTPLAVFLQDGAWVESIRRDEIAFAAPSASWSTTAARQIPPRFVARFAAEPGSRTMLPSVLFDQRVGLRDWSSASTAPQRLASLAEALNDLSAAERRDLRDQLRRAWGDIAEATLALPSSLSLVVERSGGLELCLPDANSKPVVHVTSERQGFAARALADRGEAVLDIGESDAGAVGDLLNATGMFSARLADAGDVRLVVDGIDFQVDPTDPLLVSGDLGWLGDAALFAHEYLGDTLELRTLPPDELERRLRQVRLRRCGRFALVIDGQAVPARGDDRVQHVAHPKSPTLVVRGAEDLDVDLLIEAAPALTRLIGARRNTLEQMLNRLARESFTGGPSGPSEEQYARAIRRDVAIVRDHFAATRGSVERRVRALQPVIAFLRDLDAAARLKGRHERVGPSFDLRAWLVNTLGADLADQCLAAIEETDDQTVIRRRMGFEFAAYGRTLAALGYPALNDEGDFRRLFQVFLAKLRPALLDRVRRRFIGAWREGRDLSDYVALRGLDFIAFDPRWVAEREAVDPEFVAIQAEAAIENVLGPDDTSEALPDLEPTAATNRKLVASRHDRLGGLARAWCRKTKRDRPALMEAGDPQTLVRVIDAAGLLDFEVLEAESLPGLYERIGAWPADMPASDELATLGLEQDDLEHEEREAREAKRRAEIARRTIRFAGKELDTGDAAFSHLFESLADGALAKDDAWFSRSRPPRLLPQEQRELGGGAGGKSGGKGQAWQNQPPEPIRKAMGVASEWLVREYLRRRHSAEMSDSCWVSSNRTAFCSGDDGNDGLGYDFRVVTARNEWLYEVKSALDEGGEFELSARELEVAGSASLERKRRYRILYVPFVFDPTRWRVLPLSNPAAAEMRGRFKIVRSGSVRYRFETR